MRFQVTNALLKDYLRNPRETILFHNPNSSRPPEKGGTLRLIKHLLKGLPPGRLPRLAALGPRNHGLLEAIRLLPPLPHLGVRPHQGHVGVVVGPDVLEVGEEEAGGGIVGDAVCLGDASA